MLHLYSVLAQLTDEQRGEQLGQGLVTLLGIVVIVGIVIWRKRRGSSNEYND